MRDVFHNIDRQDCSALRRTLSRGNINDVGSDGYTPLYYACMRKGVTVATVLEILQLGAQLDLKGSDHETPLYIACFNGKRDVALLLLEKGADPNATNGRSGETVLHLAARIGSTSLVDILLAKGADVNVRNVKKETPLFVAAKAGFHEVVYLLMRANANVELCDVDGKNPLYIASEKMMKHVVVLLKNEMKSLDFSKAAADDVLRSSPAPFKTTEAICNELAVEESGIRRKRHENLNKEVTEGVKPIEIIDIAVPRPKGDVRDLLGGTATRGPCRSLEEVGYDEPPAIPPSLRDRPPMRPQRIGGTVMRIGTSMDVMGVEPLRVGGVPGDAMSFSVPRD